jgi:hypothetical protein
MSSQRLSLPGLRLACVSLVLGTAVVLLAPGQGTANQLESRPAVATPTATPVRAVPDGEPVATGSVERDDVACERTRRRLWVEGEGWIVRRVTTCR